MRTIEWIVRYYERNATRVHLIFANVLLCVFAIVFSNAGLLPFRSIGDFALFFALGLILALYRPTWSFAFLIGSLALENVSLAPAQLGIALRPYQFFLVLTIVAFAVQRMKKKTPFTLPQWRWFDGALAVFAIAGFVSALGAQQKGLALKHALIVVTYIALYCVVRIFIQTFDDAKRMAPFFLSSSVVIMLYSVWQNIQFLSGKVSFEVMPGRPNGTFFEPDWLGMFLVFLIAIALTIIYGLYKKTRNLTPKIQILKEIAGYVLLIVSFIVLILSVARSAWLGAGVVSFVFLAIFLVKGDWRGLLHNFLEMTTAAVFALVIVLGFHLTNFELFNRAQSTGTGLQKITIACKNDVVPSVPIKETITIKDVKELEQYQCRHINLEDIDAEVAAGNFVTNAYREDPNINIRQNIYQTSLQEIKKHPIFGIGWGNISSVLGTDERGAGLNASNIFLETWLGSGVIGVVALISVLGYIGVAAIVQLIRTATPTTENLFVLLGFVAIIIPNLFNSGILLAFLWAFIAVAAALHLSQKTYENRH